jgi:hypothetical protein
VANTMSVQTVAINAANKTHSSHDPPASSSMKRINATGSSSAGGMVFSESGFHGLTWW